MEALYLKEPFSMAKWIKEGKPKMWIKKYDQNGIRIYTDAAYGGLKMSTQTNEATGKDMVAMKDLVCFGPYYEGCGLEIYVPYTKIKTI